MERACLAWATAGVVGMLIFAAVHTARLVYAHRSMESLGQVAREKAGKDALVCYLGKRRFSFALYAERVEAKRFSRDAEADYEALARLVRSERRVLCLVHGMSALHRLEAKVGRPLGVLGSHGKFLLVTNEPPGSSPSQPGEQRP
ncbi:MAG TPA: hypothetical protein VM031_06560 [Phycisphaerae bacterium]|nr:hypothetical protein [Phycisphaerae bacterium]